MVNILRYLRHIFFMFKLGLYLPSAGRQSHFFSTSLKNERLETACVVDKPG